MSNIKIIGTRLYQWETGRKLQVIPLTDMSIDAVHFSNVGDTEALVCKPQIKNGVFIVGIPNILLQSGKNLVVYTVNVSTDAVETLRRVELPVRYRPKPADYVYTETETYDLKKAVEEALTEAKASGTFDGKDGQNGKDGKTPQKGVDYYTDEEKAELVKEIEQTTTGDISTALDSILEIQNSLIGGGGV